LDYTQLRWVLFPVSRIFLLVDTWI
jgi:hypothetical protein